MTPVSSTPTAPLVASGLIGGYAAARHAGRSDLATVVFCAAGAVCTRSWLRSSGRRVTGILLGTYLFAFWVSHPLAKRIGGWPSVLAVSAAAAAVTASLAESPASSTGSRAIQPSTGGPASDT